MGKNIIQSYVFTTIKYSFSVYEKRILYQVIDMMQYQLRRKILNNGFKIEEDGNKDKIFTIPLSSLLTGENDFNYTRIKKAAHSLLKKTIENNIGYDWNAFSLIERPEIKSYQRYISFRLHPLVYKALLDFSKGFRKYELKIAMMFESVYSMRFYELFSEQKQVITYSVKQLKSMFHIEKKYRQTRDFIKRVIIPAQIELNKFAPYSFIYIPVKEGKKITALKFTPVYNERNRDVMIESKSLQKLINIHWSISEKIQSILFKEYKFTKIELQRHIGLFKQSEKLLNLPSELTKIKERALKARNPKGYIITSLRRILETSNVFQNMVVSPTKFRKSVIIKRKAGERKKINKEVQCVLETKSDENLSIVKARMNKTESINDVKIIPSYATNKSTIHPNISFSTPMSTTTSTKVDKKPPAYFLSRIGNWILKQFKRR